MCGVFGMIGKVNPDVIRSLAIANRERGTDSLGFFRSDGAIWKQAKDAMHALPDAASFLGWPKSWFIVGHTRAATQGSVCKPNAHPFRFGNIVGVHNGIVDAPVKYRVDSEYLFERLNECKGDYQSAWSMIDGYWTNAWYDGKSVWLACHDNKLSLMVTKNAIVFSSDSAHLRAACPPGDLYSMEDEAVIRIDAKLARFCKWSVETSFTSLATGRWSNGCGQYYYHGDRLLTSSRDYSYSHSYNSSKRQRWVSVDEMAKKQGFRDVDDAMAALGCCNWAELRTKLEAYDTKIETDLAEVHDTDLAALATSCGYLDIEDAMQSLRCDTARELREWLEYETENIERCR